MTPRLLTHFQSTLPIFKASPFQTLLPRTIPPQSAYLQSLTQISGSLQNLTDSIHQSLRRRVEAVMENVVAPGVVRFGEEVVKEVERVVEGVAGRAKSILTPQTLPPPPASYHPTTNHTPQVCAIPGTAEVQGPNSTTLLKTPYSIYPPLFYHRKRQCLDTDRGFIQLGVEIGLVKGGVANLTLAAEETVEGFQLDLLSAVMLRDILATPTPDLLLGDPLTAPLLYLRQIRPSPLPLQTPLFPPSLTELTQLASQIDILLQLITLGPSTGYSTVTTDVEPWDRGVRWGEVRESEMFERLREASRIANGYATLRNLLNNFAAETPQHLTPFVSTLKDRMMEEIEISRQEFEGTFPCRPLAIDSLIFQNHLCSSGINAIDYTWLSLLFIGTALTIYIAFYGVFTNRLTAKRPTPPHPHQNISTLRRVSMAFGIGRRWGEVVPEGQQRGKKRWDGTPVVPPVYRVYEGERKAIGFVNKRKWNGAAVVPPVYPMEEEEETKKVGPVKGKKKVGKAVVAPLNPGRRQVDVLRYSNNSIDEDESAILEEEDLPNYGGSRPSSRQAYRSPPRRTIRQDSWTGEQSRQDSYTPDRSRQNSYRFDRNRQDSSGGESGSFRGEGRQTGRTRQDSFPSSVRDSWFGGRSRQDSWAASSNREEAWRGGRNGGESRDRNRQDSIESERRGYYQESSRTQDYYRR
ncbi:hypothetical protein HDU67_005535 [Dinochytrium kinnereticum]|nr:hypothetical protein HDU67_005535 [Dinochytrium kinnereticum]